MQTWEEKKLYAEEDRVGAEFGPSRAAWWYFFILPALRHLGRRMDGNDATRYINHVMRRRRFRAAFPEANPVAVQFVEERHSWCKPGQDRVIRVGSSSRRTFQATEWDLLHELAHMVTAVPKTARQRHGSAWKDNYVLLVRIMRGKRAARCLAVAIESNRCP